MLYVTLPLLGVRPLELSSCPSWQQPGVLRNLWGSKLYGTLPLVGVGHLGLASCPSWPPSVLGNLYVLVQPLVLCLSFVSVSAFGFPASLAVTGENDQQSMESWLVLRSGFSCCALAVEVLTTTGAPQLTVLTAICLNKPLRPKLLKFWLFLCFVFTAICLHSLLHLKLLVCRLFLCAVLATILHSPLHPNLLVFWPSLCTTCCLDSHLSTQPSISKAVGALVVPLRSLLS